MNVSDNDDDDDDAIDMFAGRRLHGFRKFGVRHLGKSEPFVKEGLECNVNA